MIGVACQEVSLLHGSVSTTYHGHILTFEEKAIAGSTGAHAAPLQALFARQSQPLCARPGRDNNGTCQVLARISREPERALAKIDRCHIFGDHLRPEAAGLDFELLHHRGAKNTLFKARIVLHVAGQHQLSTHLVALEHEHREVSA